MLYLFSAQREHHTVRY